jgi:uncharacterized protein (DUF779 family)
MITRVLVSEDAKKVIDQLRDEHGPLMFHQSGGCCDGSSPMCFTEGEYLISDNDAYMGEVHGCPFYMSKEQYEYWKHTELTLDVTSGRGASFSLEIPLGLRFVIKSRIFSQDEIDQLPEVTYGSPSPV